MEHYTGILINYFTKRPVYLKFISSVFNNLSSSNNMKNGISVYKMPRHKQGLSTDRNKTLYKYKRSKKDRKISAHSNV